MNNNPKPKSTANDIQRMIDDLSEHEYNLLTRNGETDVFGVPVDYEDSYEYDDN